MCVIANFSEIVKLEEDKIFYKVISDFRASLFSPLHRSSQYKIINSLNSYFYKGRTCTYNIGKTYNSDITVTPGFYCFTNISDAKSYKKTVRKTKLIAVKVKKGTNVVFGWIRGHEASYRKLKTVNVEELTVMSDVLI